MKHCKVHVRNGIYFILLNIHSKKKNVNMHQRYKYILPLYIEHLLYLRDCCYNLTKFKDVYFRTIGKILTLVGLLFSFYFVSSFTLVVFNIYNPLQCNFQNSWEWIHMLYFRRARKKWYLEVWGEMEGKFRHFIEVRLEAGAYNCITWTLSGHLVTWRQRETEKM